MTPELVDEAYDALLGPERRKDFAHWEKRLDEEAWTPQERDLIDAILVAAAQNPKGISRDTIAQLKLRVASDSDHGAILHSLEHDGYLVCDDGRHRFVSTLLRDWWLRWKV